MLDVTVMVSPVGKAVGTNKDATVRTLSTPGVELNLDSLFTLVLQVLELKNLVSKCSKKVCFPQTFKSS